MPDQPRKVTVRIPATTANLGPGFDCLAMALDLWNEFSFEITGEDIQVEIHGLGVGNLPTDDHNMIARVALNLFGEVGVRPPEGLLIRCENRVPLGSGMGSSASAVLAGLAGANALLGQPLSDAQLLTMAAGIEGHPDNVAAAQAGGLVLVTKERDSFLVRKFPVATLNLVVVVPEVHLPTRVARAALPKAVPMTDAVFNIARTTLVVEALRSGDLTLLNTAMDDRLHQPYRLKLVPGSEAAFTAARQAGAAAVALSGAGPSIIAFAPDHLPEIGQAMVKAFAEVGVVSTALPMRISESGIQLQLA